MAANVLTGGNLRAAFGTNPLSIISLKNLKTGLQFLHSGAQSVFVRMPRAISDPVFLTRVESSEHLGDTLRLALRDEDGEYRAELTIGPSTDGLEFHIAVTAPEPLWVVEWKLDGLILNEVVLPALGGQALSKKMPPDTSLTYKYPFWLNAQFVLGMTRGGGMWFRCKDERPVFKFVRVRRKGETFTLAYGIEADGPLNSRTLEATWYIDCFKGSWKVPTDIYRTWMEKTFRAVRLGPHSGLPAWAKDIDFVLELWGMGKDSPEPFHTFDQMAQRLRSWKQLHDPARTLVYLPGFAAHGIDSRAPEYTPSPYLGGAEKFRGLIDSAHSLGYHVMAHTNAIAMTFNHRLFGRFERHQVVDVFGRRQGWGLDLDGDWLTEPYFAYINPGVREWGDAMVRTIEELIRSFGLDAVFLDQTLLAFNVSRGPNFVTGMREHIRRLQKTFPGILFAGEGLHEHVLEVLPMVQIHGIDSITEVHGVEEQTRWRTPHAVSTYLFGPYTRFMAHLLTRHPSHPSFRFQETSYARLGVIPALCLYRHDQKMDMPEVRKMLRRAREVNRNTS
jgi:hypothetical protein